MPSTNRSMNRSMRGPASRDAVSGMEAHHDGVTTRAQTMQPRSIPSEGEAAAPIIDVMRLAGAAIRTATAVLDAEGQLAVMRREWIDAQVIARLSRHQPSPPPHDSVL
jgi:hypothetical protein